jgi:hypothetical protein
MLALAGMIFSIGNSIDTSFSTGNSFNIATCFRPLPHKPSSCRQYKHMIIGFDSTIFDCRFSTWVIDL